MSGYFTPYMVDAMNTATTPQPTAGLLLQRIFDHHGILFDHSVPIAEQSAYLYSQMESAERSEELANLLKSAMSLSECVDTGAPPLPSSMTASTSTHDQLAELATKLTDVTQSLRLAAHMLSRDEEKSAHSEWIAEERARQQGDWEKQVDDIAGKRAEIDEQVETHLKETERQLRMDEE